MLEKLFQNPGKKIKNLAKVLFIINIILSFIAAYYFGFEYYYNYYTRTYTRTVTILLPVILIVGPIASYISSLLLYGFGQLISPEETKKEQKDNKPYICDECSKSYNYDTADHKCPNCGGDIRAL